MEGCKVCQDADCNGDSLQIIENACFDSSQLGCPTILRVFAILMNAFIRNNSFLNLFPGTSYKQLSSLMSIPLSTSTTTNDYIDSINSEFNFQLAEMTVFQFPNSDQRMFQI